MVRDVTELRRQRDLIAMQRRVLELVASDEPAVTSLLVIAALISAQIDGATAVVLADGDPTSRLGVVLEHDEGPGRLLPEREAMLASLNAVSDQQWMAVGARRTALMLACRAGQGVEAAGSCPAGRHHRPFRRR
jgi:hypothetical protein